MKQFLITVAAGITTALIIQALNSKEAVENG